MSGQNPRSRTLLAFAAFSTASGLFFFGCFKLMNFHWLFLNALVILLLVGMPIGGFVAVGWLRPELASLSLGLGVQVATMVATLALFPLLMDPVSRIDRLLTGTLRVSGLTFTIVKFAQLALVFTPYFVALGMNEFLGYRLVLPALGNRSELAYALFLAGSAAAYGTLELAAPHVGVVPLLVGAAGALGLVAAALAGARRRRTLTTVGTLLLVVATLPGLEDRYISALELEGPLQLRTIRRQPGVEILYRRWGRYCHLTIAALSPTKIAGFYNGGLHWYHRTSRTAGDLARAVVETAPFAMLPPHASVLIIGTGGGEQIRRALEHAPAKVVAAEVIPEVLRLLGGRFGERVGHVYEDPRVVPVAMDGRRYLDATDERFDLIFLPVVDTSVTMIRSLWNPAETLYTVEAFDSMRRHLTDDGVLVIQRPAFFDQSGVLLRQYFRALADLGMSPYVWLDNPRALGGRSGPGIAEPAFTTDSVYLLFARRNPAAGRLPADVETRLRAVGFVRADDLGTYPYLPKTDDQLFRANLLFNALGGSPLNRIFATMIGVTVLVGALVVWLLRATVRPTATPAFWTRLGLGVLVGLNFLLLEQLVIWKLCRILPRPMDAMFLGTVGFMVVAGASGLVLTPRRRLLAGALTVAALAAAILALGVVTPETVPGVLVAVPLVAVTGALFPTVFRGDTPALLTVFAADALGAFVGGIVALLWPLAYGFRSYDRVTLAVFVLTAAVVITAAPALTPSARGRRG